MTGIKMGKFMSFFVITQKNMTKAMNDANLELLCCLAHTHSSYQ